MTTLQTTTAGTMASAAAETTNTQSILVERPKRPLSSYNLFFQSERKKLLASLPTRSEGKPRHSHGKCGFANMTKMIAKKWKDGDIDPDELTQFQQIASLEQKRYRAEIAEYKKLMAAIKKEGQKAVSDAANAKMYSTKSKMDATGDSSATTSVCLDLQLPQDVSRKTDEPVPASSSLDNITSNHETHHYDRLVCPKEIQRLAERLDPECVEFLVNLFLTH